VGFYTFRSYFKIKNKKILSTTNKFYITIKNSNSLEAQNPKAEKQKRRTAQRDNNTLGPKIIKEVKNYNL